MILSTTAAPMTMLREGKKAARSRRVRVNMIMTARATLYAARSPRKSGKDFVLKEIIIYFLLFKRLRRSGSGA